MAAAKKVSEILKAADAQEGKPAVEAALKNMGDLMSKAKFP